MPSDNPENTPKSEQERIGELENQVQELSGLIEVLLAKPENQVSLKEVIHGEPPVETSDGMPRRRRLTSEMRESISRALGGNQGESLESRIGGIWLGYVVAVLFLTLIVVGGIITLQDDSLTALHKVVVGYAASVATISYGLIARKRDNFFPSTCLGAGLAAFYFTTYAAFFLESTQLLAEPSVGLPVLAATLLSVTLVAHWRRSQTVAGISLFLIYYTVVLSLSQGMTEENIMYALFTGALLAVVALGFHLTHRWLLFTWGALLATQITYIYFFVLSPPDLPISDTDFFWYSVGFLTLVFCVFSAASVTDARRTGEFRKTVAPMAGVNSFVYLVLTWIAIRTNFPEYEWAFRLGQTALFLSFTCYAFITGPKKNYLFQIFAAKTFIIFTLALQSSFSHAPEWLLVALSLECLALGFSYMRSGLVIFKVLGLGLLSVVFFGSLLIVKNPDTIDILGYTIQVNWAACIAVAFVLSIVGWFFEHFVRRLPPHERLEKGQWFLADSWINLSGGSTALLHTSAGALILMAITIIDLGDRPELPFLLAIEGVVMALLGLLLATPQVEIASVLLIVAAHVCYHIFLWVGKAGFEAQENYVLYTSVVAAVTFFGGYLWERYLRRIEGGSQFEHDAVASLPYIAGTMMLVSLMERNLEAIYAPVAQSLLAAALLIGSSLTMLAGLRIAGLIGLALSAVSFYAGTYTYDFPITSHEDFFLGLVIMLLCYTTAERACALWERRLAIPSWTAKIVRTALVVLGSLVGLLGLSQWAEAGIVTIFWGLLAFLWMFLGWIFRESRYRWVALTLYIAAVVRFLVFDLANEQPILRFLISLVLTVPGIAMAWGYSEYRERQLQKLHRPPEIKPTPKTPGADESITDG